MYLNKVILCRYHYRISFVVAWKSIVNSSEIFSDFEWGVQRLIPIQSSIGCEDEIQISEVAGEVTMAKIVGVLSV